MLKNCPYKFPIISDSNVKIKADIEIYVSISNVKNSTKTEEI